MNATPKFLLEGSYYALIQCGRLLTSAVILYKAGDFLVIYPCDQGNLFRSPSRSRMTNGLRCLKRWCDGHEGMSLQ